MDLKFKTYKFKLERNNKDGTKSEVSVNNLSLQEEMVFLSLIDKYVEKNGVEDANKVFEYIKSK